MGTGRTNNASVKGPDGLTQLQRTFCEEYVKHFNATEAYMAASTTENRVSARTMGYKLLQKPEIKREIERLQKMMYEAQFVNFERIASELSNIAFHSDSEQSRLKALSLLQKQLGLEKTVVNADINQTVEIKVDITDEN